MENDPTSSEGSQVDSITCPTVNYYHKVLLDPLLDVAAVLDPPLNELLVWDYKDSNTQLASSLVVSDLR